jgi:hypothetical protein
MKQSAVRTSHASDAASDLSVPGAILPEQYFDRLALRASDIPEKRLMFAVLLDAVILLRRRHTPGAAEAERWVRGEDGDDESPFCFRNVCEALGIDPSYLARGLLTWRVSGLPYGMPVRQLRTSSRRVTPLARRRRDAADPD